MNKKKINKGISQGRVAENRRAKFDYSIIDTVEAGIVLLGLDAMNKSYSRLLSTFAIILNSCGN